MKKPSLFLVLLLSCALVACDDDDSFDVAPPDLKDTASPSVRISAPIDNATYVIIETLELVAHLEDDVGFSEVRVFLTDPDGNDSLIYVDDIRFYAKTSEYKLLLRTQKETLIGIYKLKVEVEDRAQNVAQSTVSINFHAPDLNNADFSRVFPSGSIFYAYDWFWVGIDFSKGIRLNEPQFNFFLYEMANVQIGQEILRDEWNRFIADFGIRNQSWADWDEDSNGSVGLFEFERAISETGLFREWDTDNNTILNEAEFASGVFDRWDSNNNGVLSREEYLERYYTYFFRELE